MGLGRFRHVMVAVALWAIVAVVGTGADPDRSTWLGTSSLDTVVLVGLLAASTLGAIFLIVLRPIGIGEPEPRERRRGSLLLMIAIALLVLVWRPDLLGPFQDTEQDTAATAAESNDDVGTSDDDGADRVPIAELGDVIGLMALAAAIGMTGLFLLRPRTPPDDGFGTVSEHHERAGEIFAAAVEVAHDRVLATDDPRHAVIAAYATLEQALAAHDLARRRAETAEEHLRRATSTLGADPAPFAELGRLYAVARFSDREVSERFRDQASAALERASLALEVAP